MFDKAKRISTVLVIRGLLALLFGVLVLSLKPEALAGIVMILFGVFAIVDGTFAIVGALAAHETMEDWWLMLLAGVLGILIGVFTFARPHLIGSVLVMYIGLRAIMQGLLEIVFAVRLRKAIEGEWLWIFGGAMSLLFGLIMIMFPIEGETFQGLLVIGWLIGIYAIAAGAMQLVLAGQIRDWIKRIQEKPSART
jgi:uncharacterized membrane protein HdeD (DUF308 family)